MRFSGWVPDRPDKRDFSAAELLGSVQTPVPQSAGRPVLEILDQGPVPTCVNNSVALVVREAHRSVTPNPRLMSRMFGHACSKAQHGALLDPGSGTMVRAAFKALSRFGFCPETEYPYDLDNVAKQPPMHAFSHAYDQRVTEYRRIFEVGTARVEAFKRAIAQGYNVVFGTMINDRFGRNSTSARPQDLMILQTGEPTSGHAMAACMYDGDAFRLANSWGPTRGDNGYDWVTAESIAWDETRDPWVLITAPNYSEAP